MNINGDLYIVSRPKGYRLYPEVGCNDVFVCATNENQAKGIALATHIILDKYDKDIKKDIIVKKIDNINIGDVLMWN